MIPPHSMLTIKNRGTEATALSSGAAAQRSALRRPCFAVQVAAILFLTGCGPPGPRALFSGKKLLETGHYEEAIAKFKLATSLLSTNAQAWNYLGLAYHHAGRPEEAANAYSRALALNHDLNEAHFNLGCLWLAQNKFEAAKTEFTIYTLRRGNSAEGFLKLAAAQLHCHELSGAEKSFNDVLRLSPQNVEALTGLGVVSVQRGHADEGAQDFKKVLKLQPDYAPAMLNLAVVQQEYVKDRQGALQTYRSYLALRPAPGNSEAVREVVNQLEQELAPPVHATATTASSQANTNAAMPKPVPVEPTRVVTTPKPVPTNTTRLASAPKTDSGGTSARPPSTANTPKPAPAVTAAAAVPLEVVRLADEPPLKTADDVSPPRTAAAEPTASAPTSSVLEVSNNRGWPRYAYKSPRKPAAGNRTEAERVFAQGAQAHQAGRLPEAIQAYRRAEQADPSYFDAHYNLALAASALGNLPMALGAYEAALAVKPGSVDARYNFVLALKQAGYPVDAAQELEKLLAQNPNDSRTHLALGNLYAQQLQQPVKARTHYLKVLEIDPRNSQAGAIRYWLDGGSH
jgi:Flp pilus assembly protein TadD